ncbi:MAG: DUF4270 domain-containing protein [Sphingobacteriaceae bacterium]
MKVFKLDLLTLLIGLFILGSCNNPDEIGLDVDPTNSINTNVVESSAIKAFTVPEDKINTAYLSQYPIGYLVDPEMGITQAGTAATLNLPSEGLTFGTNIVLDSAVLVLRYGTSFYGDSLTSPQRFTVYQLSDKLNAATTYYQNTSIPFNNTEIGSLIVNKIKLQDSIKVKQIVKGAADTELKQPPHIRIPMDATFIQNNFFSASADKFATSSAFIDFIKGLYLKTDAPVSPKLGGIPFFDFSSGASKLELYYRNVGATIDTNYVVFTINNNSTPVVAHFSHNYAGTAVETQLANPNTEYTKTFVQALSGVRTKITFPDLANLKSLGNIIINKAVLEVKIENGTDVPFAPAPRLMLYQTDIAGQRQPLPDLNPYDPRSLGLGGFGGLYDSTTKTYKFTVTGYIQDLLSGKAKQYASYLAVVDKAVSNLTVAVQPFGTVADKAVIGSGKTGAASQMKLKIIYTKLNN